MTMTDSYSYTDRDRYTTNTNQHLTTQYNVMYMYGMYVKDDCNPTESAAHLYHTAIRVIRR